MTQPDIGDPAPSFDLPAGEGRYRLEDFRGRWLVLYFYPADFTGGCTIQACDFRDRGPELDATVVGVSPDPAERHRDFAREHGLSYPLLSDEDHAVAQRYGAWGEKERDGTTYQGLIRSTFIIDPQGRIAAAMRDVRVSGHVEWVRQRLVELQTSAVP